MLKRKIGKKFAAGLTALAMCASASAASISTLTAFAGELLGEGTFNEGAGLPWHVCENGTGAMAFDIADGVYSIYIKNPGGRSNGGEDRWDCQFRHRGLSLNYGDTYRLTYSVWTSQAGYMYAKLGEITNDDCEYWHNNGFPLNMSYEEGASQEEVESALKSASTNGAEVKHWEGWDKWKTQQIAANKWTTYAWEFTLNKSDINNTTPPDKVDGTAEWTFHFGGDGEFTPSICFPEGTVLKFDNLAFINMSKTDDDWVDPPEKADLRIALNQVGYFPNLNKKATLTVDEGDSAAKEFTVYNSSGTAVKTGKTSDYKYDLGGWEYTQCIDFSDVTETGDGFYIECDGAKSLTFSIGDDIYEGMTTNAMNYFYLNRSGIDLDSKYVTGGDAALARKAGHKPDTAYLTDEWIFIYTEDPVANGTYSKSIDVTGGWYDAGDYGKYVVNGGVSMWTLASLYERAVEVSDTAAKWDDNSGTVVIPEAGNKIPDILDELMWEADFMLKMQRDDGMVYHKIHDYKWTALGVMPYLEDGTDPEKEDVVFPSRIVKPATYAATLNLAGALSQLARLVKPYDSAKAATYEAAAVKAYDAAKTTFEGKYGDVYKEMDGDPTKDDMFAPLDQNKGGGPYGDTNVDDEFYWAACELYITTGDTKYYDDLKAYPEAFKVPTALHGGENNGSFTSFTWGTLASLGTMSLSMHDDLLSAAEVTAIEDSIMAAADDYREHQTETSGYGTPYKGMNYDIEITTISGSTATTQSKTLENGYEWGSNSMVVNNAIVMGFAYDVSEDAKYLNGVAEAFDYILGRNAMDNSYVTGYGQVVDGVAYVTQNPHHRYWCNQMKADWPKAPAACLSGGPNSTMNDPMIQGAGYKVGELAPMKCYYDQVDAWSVNEITINWNSPLVWISSFLEDEAPLASDTPTTTEPDTDPDDVLYGDANCDGSVSIVDVIFLNKSVMGAEKLSAQGKINADVDRNGEADAGDSLNILKSLVDLVTLPIGG